MKKNDTVAEECEFNKFMSACDNFDKKLGVDEHRCKFSEPYNVEPYGVFYWKKSFLRMFEGEIERIVKTPSINVQPNALFIDRDWETSDDRRGKRFDKKTSYACQTGASIVGANSLFMDGSQGEGLWILFPCGHDGLSDEELSTKDGSSDEGYHASET